MAKLYKYPNPDEIQINESDLRLKFRDYKDSLKGDVSLLDFFVIVPAWLPVFFSDFKDFHNIPGIALKAIYATLIGIASLAWLVSSRHFFLRLSVFIYNKLLRKDSPSIGSEINPDKKVDEIKKECVEVDLDKNFNKGPTSRKS